MSPVSRRQGLGTTIPSPRTKSVCASRAIASCSRQTTVVYFSATAEEEDLQELVQDRTNGGQDTVTSVSSRESLSTGSLHCLQVAVHREASGWRRQTGADCIRTRCGGN